MQVTAQGPLSLSDPGSGIIASATSTASGNAGSVMVTAPQIALVSGAEISSTTAGTGAGGSVDVTTPGALVLDGAGVANTQIAASATGPQSGPGGSVTVNANSLTVEGGAQIASSTAGSRQGRRCRCHRRFRHRAAGSRTANHRAIDRQRRCRVDHRLGRPLVDEQRCGDLDRGGNVDGQRRQHHVARRAISSIW